MLRLHKLRWVSGAGSLWPRGELATGTPCELATGSPSELATGLTFRAGHRSHPASWPWAHLPSWPPGSPCELATGTQHRAPCEPGHRSTRPRARREQEGAATAFPGPTTHPAGHGSSGRSAREADGSHRCDFGAVGPILGLGKRWMPREGAHPSRPLPPAKLPSPHSSASVRVPGGGCTDRRPPPAAAPRRQQTPNGQRVAAVPHYFTSRERKDSARAARLRVASRPALPAPRFPPALSAPRFPPGV